jgi:hypothetical protein
VETCDEKIAQENDHLKVDKLNKQAEVQPPQDNCSNVVKKLEKGKTISKIASQPPKKQVQNENYEKYRICKKCLLDCNNATYQQWNWIQKW